MLKIAHHLRIIIILINKKILLLSLLLFHSLYDVKLSALSVFIGMSTVPWLVVDAVINVLITIDIFMLFSLCVLCVALLLFSRQSVGYGVPRCMKSDPINVD